MSSVLFFIATIGVLAGAVGVVMLRNPFYSVLALVVHLIALAVLFLLLRAEFVAAIQVVIYAGAVMVLYVFVIAYVGGEGETIGARLRSQGPAGAALRRAGAILAAALLVELLIALLGTGLRAIDGYGAGYKPGPQAYGTPAYIGKLLLTRFLLAFEVASFLLLIAAVGGVVLATDRSSASSRGAPPDAEGGPGDEAGHRAGTAGSDIAPPPTDRRSAGVPTLTGSMVEGVGPGV